MKYSFYKLKFLTAVHIGAGALDEVEDSKSKLIVFCHYVEALVAYRKFKGNDK